MPTSPRTDFQEVPLGKGYQEPEGAWILFENPGDVYTLSHTALLAREVVIYTEIETLLNESQYILSMQS